tara:strand:+ start:1392 stop:1610 length:219 start_codon:yes stop_codon:yes gene_type:complete
MSVVNSGNGYNALKEAQRDISYYLMTRYNWLRPHQLNSGLAPAKAEKNLIHCPESVDHYTMTRLAQKAFSNQ